MNGMTSAIKCSTPVFVYVMVRRFCPAACFNVSGDKRCRKVPKNKPQLRSGTVTTLEEYHSEPSRVNQPGV